MPPGNQPPKPPTDVPKPVENPEEIDQDDAMIEEPKDDVFEDGNGSKPPGKPK